jgi:hypothetical protein
MKVWPSNTDGNGPKNQTEGRNRGSCPGNRAERVFTIKGKSRKNEKKNGEEYIEMFFYR